MTMKMHEPTGAEIVIALAIAGARKRNARKVIDRSAYVPGGYIKDQMYQGNTQLRRGRE